MEEKPAEPVVWLKGRFVPASAAHISIYDYGIVLGATVTDLLRTFRHQLYRLDDHIDRFFQSCKYARIKPPLTKPELAAVTVELAQRNASLIGAGDDLAAVLFITPGENLVYAGAAASSVPMEPTLCVHSFPLPFALWRRFFETGVHLVTPSTRHVPPQCVDPKIKCRSRMHWWLAEQEAHLGDPHAVPLLLDLDGNLTETSGANFLLVRKGRVISPGSRNILRGVSRQVVMELCVKLGIPFEERDLQVHDALTAEEAFLTTTPYCMAPVTRVNGVTVGDGRVGGPLFERILAGWSGDVGIDIRRQVLA